MSYYTIGWHDEGVDGYSRAPDMMCPYCLTAKVTSIECAEVHSMTTSIHFRCAKGHKFALRFVSLDGVILPFLDAPTNFGY